MTFYLKLVKVMISVIGVFFIVYKKYIIVISLTFLFELYSRGAMYIGKISHSILSKSAVAEHQFETGH